MTKNKNLLEKYDLSSVTTIWTGAAPLGAETIEDVHQTWPKWLIRQGYGKFTKWRPTDKYNDCLQG